MTLGYRKYCCWVAPRELRNFRGRLENLGQSVVEEERLPCRVLRRSVEIGLILPPAWQGLCRRRTSWYQSSDKKDRFLLVSNQPIPFAAKGLTIHISESNFRPDDLPTPREIREMAASPSFQKEKPSAWEEVDPSEREFYQRWFERWGGEGPFDFEGMLRVHAANHANFVDPRFYLLFEGRKVPYSIASSLWTCSSCLEFFNILGGEWPLKYVTACAGAVHFARLPRDQYFRVSVYDSVGIQERDSECQRAADPKNGP